MNVPWRRVQILVFVAVIAVLVVELPSDSETALTSDVSRDFKESNGLRRLKEPSNVNTLTQAPTTVRPTSMVTLLPTSVPTLQPTPLQSDYKLNRTTRIVTGPPLISEHGCGLEPSSLRCATVWLHPDETFDSVLALDRAFIAALLSTKTRLLIAGDSHGSGMFDLIRRKLLDTAHHTKFTALSCSPFHHCNVVSGNISLRVLRIINYQSPDVSSQWLIANKVKEENYTHVVLCVSAWTITIYNSIPSYFRIRYNNSLSTLRSELGAHIRLFAYPPHFYSTSSYALVSTVRGRGAREHLCNTVPRQQVYRRAIMSAVRESNAAGHRVEVLDVYNVSADVIALPTVCRLGHHHNKPSLSGIIMELVRLVYTPESRRVFPTGNASYPESLKDHELINLHREICSCDHSLEYYPWEGTNIIPRAHMPIIKNPDRCNMSSFLNEGEGVVLPDLDHVEDFNDCNISYSPATRPSPLARNEIRVAFFGRETAVYPLFTSICKKLDAVIGPVDSGVALREGLAVATLTDDVNGWTRIPVHDPTHIVVAISVFQNMEPKRNLSFCAAPSTVMSRMLLLLLQLRRKFPAVPILVVKPYCDPRVISHEPRYRQILQCATGMASSFNLAAPFQQVVGLTGGSLEADADIILSAMMFGNTSRIVHAARNVTFFDPAFRVEVDGYC